MARGAALTAAQTSGDGDRAVAPGGSPRPQQGRPRRLDLRWPTLGMVRLWTGLILFAFVLGHLINHAFGIISLDAQNAASHVLLAPWTNPLGGLVLVTAAILHVIVNLYTLWRRRTLRLKAWEAVQYLSGLLIPVLMLDHALANRLMIELYQANTDYYVVQGFFWLAAPTYGIKQAAALIIAWTHGSIGIWHWLKVRRWFARARTVLLASALIIPALSLAGFVASGNEILREAARDPELLAFLLDDANWTPENLARIHQIYLDALVVYGLILGTIAVAWAIRRAKAGIGGARVTYGEGRSVPLLPGATLLETLRANGIPHPSVCGGRARCTTCRVLVRHGFEDLPAPEPTEATALHRIGFPDHVRLACQIRPETSLSVVPLLSPHATAADGRRPGHLFGREQLVTVLFVDLRGSTGLGEARLPFDTLFILNQFFAEMIRALMATGGHYSNFTGDGLMALYGLTGRVEDGCRDALRGADAMLARLAALNEALKTDLPEPLRIGVGIHTGEAIVGEMGPPDARTVSAIGDTVNITARLEGLSKELGAPIIVSEETMTRAATTLQDLKPIRRKVRGRVEPIGVFALAAVPAEVL
ncbi:adenylate/guanylate cyclase domain-containing protein [Microbaculum marinum]|uniref:Adenylate/guanylate cyclase domain-containing protein n=1 Tax=Microbaculum marinum TaxID=1764581 RepID=A0AAW9RIS0_9HYPH